MGTTSQYSSFFRSYLFPILDQANGTRINGVLRFLEESESSSLEELRDLQNRKLESLLKFTGSHLPFYSSFWEQASDSSPVDSEYPLLRGLPLVRKEELRKAQDQFPVPTYKGRIIRSKTSGSTGQPMTFIRSMEQEAL